MTFDNRRLQTKIVYNNPDKEYRTNSKSYYAQGDVLEACNNPHNLLGKLQNHIKLFLESHKKENRGKFRKKEKERKVYLEGGIFTGHSSFSSSKGSHSSWKKILAVTQRGNLKEKIKKGETLHLPTRSPKF